MMEPRPFPLPQDKAGNELPLPEAISVLLQAEMQAMQQLALVRTTLKQALDQQAQEASKLAKAIDQRGDIPKPLKKSWKKHEFWTWWGGLQGETEIELGEYKRDLEYHERYLETHQRYSAELKQVREEFGRS